ncbi:hypothetical protein FE257_010201 [Aspergillus nanangensis]|uniref:Uncharacterized protein n=1 Tax=Aspergillus nanangensis TaxID=2582783 RepID=A0AAD4CJ31_ASPNN|nr:hypothetical protein FE257_010201 [Aspergillus nanangensis]
MPAIHASRTGDQVKSKRFRTVYECKSSAQERPYVPRPSRTQQLLNPKLRPQLTTEVPKDVLNPKGVADDILAKREEERGRKRDLDEADPLDSHIQTSKRARSISSHSVSSISTISTNRSRSKSPRRQDDYTAKGRAIRRRNIPLLLTPLAKELALDHANGLMIETSGGGIGNRAPRNVVEPEISPEMIANETGPEAKVMIQEALAT